MSFSGSFKEDKFLFEMSSLSKAKIEIHDYNEDHMAWNKGVSLHELLYYICVSRLLQVSVCMYMCRCFETGGSLGRRVKCRRVPQPRWVGARPSAKGGSEVAGDRRERGGNPAAFVFVPCPGRVHLQ
jgi:hypothetical protein